jgi:hypothetical protein
MIKAAKWILLLGVLGAFSLEIMSYYLYAEEIEVASALFDSNEELLAKYGKTKFRILNRVRNYGGNGNWKLELHFVSLRE